MRFFDCWLLLLRRHQLELPDAVRPDLAHVQGRAVGAHGDGVGLPEALKNAQLRPITIVHVWTK